jgi:23S rRNA pseudouridine2605 synthase
MLERLHKVLARAGVAALRPAEDMVMAGRVTVNGRVVRELGARVDPDTDQIAVDGQIIDVPAPSDPHRYVILHKPVGVISTAQDTHERPTVVELIPSDERLFPVGRLDADSEGLILLTNDGDLAYRLTHPRFEVEKEYRVLLDRTPTLADLRQWREGVELEGEMTLPVWAELLDRIDAGTWVRIVMREGRNRQIRNVAQLLGYDVMRLIRVREGPLSLGDLAAGQWRELTAAEVEALRAHVRHIPSQETDQRREERGSLRERAVNDDSARPIRDRDMADRPRQRPAFSERARPASDRARPAPERRPRSASGDRTDDQQRRSAVSEHGRSEERRRTTDQPRSIRDVGRSGERRPAQSPDRRASGAQRERGTSFDNRERGVSSPQRSSGYGSQRDRSEQPYGARSGRSDQRERGTGQGGRPSGGGPPRRDERNERTTGIRSGLGRFTTQGGQRTDTRERGTGAGQRQRTDTRGSTERRSIRGDAPRGGDASRRERPSDPPRGRDMQRGPGTAPNRQGRSEGQRPVRSEERRPPQRRTNEEGTNRPPRPPRPRRDDEE